MTRIACLTAALMTVACAAPSPPRVSSTVPAVPSTVASEPNDALRWVDVRRELEALICMKTFDVPGHGLVEEPIEGHRDACELPPAATPIERAVDKAWADAGPILASLIARYLAAYVWPDPVVTPRDARGKPKGEPKYSMHICVGTNGIGEIPAADLGLVELGFLATFHNTALRERAPVLFKEIRTEPPFRQLRDDDARTQWLRSELGSRLAAEAEIRAAVCETVERFRSETGITITECTQWTTRAATP